MRRKLKIITAITTSILILLMNSLPTRAEVTEQVHIKPRWDDLVTFDDLINLITETNTVSYTNLSDVFANNTLSAVYDILKLPSTDEGTRQDTDIPGDNSKGGSPDNNCKLQFGEWFDVIGANGEALFDEGKHSWTIDPFTLKPSSSAWQQQYNNSAASFVDEYGFRKYKADGVEYYGIAIPIYFACEGAIPGTPEYDYNNFELANGCAFQVELKDGNIVNCYMADAKALSDPLMRSDYRGHSSYAKDQPPTAVVETVIVKDNSIWPTGSISSAKNREGTPWTSDPVRIRKGPRLPLE